MDFVICYGYGYGDWFLGLVFSIIGIPMELLTIGIYSRRDNVVVISGWMTYSLLYYYTFNYAIFVPFEYINTKLYVSRSLPPP